MTRVGIIGGKGKMGGALADFLRAQGHEVLIADRGTPLSNIALAKQADVVVISVPIDKTEKVILEIAPHVKRSSLLMDVTSLKERPVRAMLTSKASVIGAHPMCNQTTFGPGQTLLYCPARPGKWMKWFRETFETHGGFTLVKMTPIEHDQQMSLVQGLIHFLEIVLGKTLADLKPNLAEMLRLASPSSQLQIKISARHLAQDPNLYGNIQLHNPQNLRVQKAYQRALEELSDIVGRKDLKAFETYFKTGKTYFGSFGEKALQETDAMIQRMIRMPTPQPLTKVSKQAIGCLGPEFTFSALAAERWRGSRKMPIVCLNTIAEVTQAVAQGKIAEGVIPIENRLQGTVRETMDALFSEKVFIVGELQLPIHHTLAALPSVSARDIRGIISHPQALNQCGIYLKKHYPHAEWITASSTAAGFEYIHKHLDRTLAAVGTKEAAKQWGLKVLARAIENDHDNFTRFVVVRAKPNDKPPTHGAKTSLIFYFSKNRPGSLFSVFKVFADMKINLSRIESRPAPKKCGEYLFYLDFEESGASKKGKQALQAVNKRVDGLKVLGSY